MNSCFESKTHAATDHMCRPCYYTVFTHMHLPHMCVCARPNKRRYVPDRSYLSSLLSHLQGQLVLCGPDALAMCLWGLAALRQQHMVSPAWGQQWCAAALGVAGQFGPQALAHGLSGMAALRIQPPAELMQVGGWLAGRLWLRE